MGFKDYNAKMDEEQLKGGSKKVENLYNEYKDKAEDEWRSELFKYVAKQKENGTLDYENLSNMLNQISPFLNEQQKNKMKDILNQIK